MKIETCTSSPDDVLERYRPRAKSHSWQLVASGFWSQDIYHGGHVADHLAKTTERTWVMDAVECNTELDDVTEEDVAEGRLNDDQIQAMWGMSLEEAQNQEYRRIVAVCLHAPKNAKAKEIARLMYDAICRTDGKRIDEPE